MDNYSHSSTHSYGDSVYIAYGYVVLHDDPNDYLVVLDNTI